MKICWDNLENMKITVHGNFNMDKHIYVEMDSCKLCGDPYLTRKDCPGLFCDRSCANTGENNAMYDKTHTIEVRKRISISIKGKNHPMYGRHHTVATKQRLSKINSGNGVGALNPSWKGGVRKKNLPLYNTYANQIDYIYEVRSVIQDGLKLIEVKCKNCNKWFVPKATNIQKRIRSLLGKDCGESDFYCSDECKDVCTVFAQKKWPKDHKPSKIYKSDQFTENELKIWREEVLKRERYICEYCGKEAVIAHHSRPKKAEPFFALDPDYGVACCKVCHYKYGHKDKCSTVNLAHMVCR